MPSGRLNRSEGESGPGRKGAVGQGDRSAELQLRPMWRVKDTLIAPGWSPALQFRGSWLPCMRRSEWSAPVLGRRNIGRLQVWNQASTSNLAEVAAAGDGRTPPGNPPKTPKMREQTN